MQLLTLNLKNITNIQIAKKNFKEKMYYPLIYWEYQNANFFMHRVNAEIFFRIFSHVDFVLSFFLCEKYRKFNSFYIKPRRTFSFNIVFKVINFLFKKYHKYTNSKKKI